GRAIHEPCVVDELLAVLHRECAGIAYRLNCGARRVDAYRRGRNADLRAAGIAQVDVQRTFGGDAGRRRLVLRRVGRRRIVDDAGDGRAPAGTLREGGLIDLPASSAVESGAVGQSDGQIVVRRWAYRRRIDRYWRLIRGDYHGNAVGHGLLPGIDQHIELVLRAERDRDLLEMRAADVIGGDSWIAAAPGRGLDIVDHYGLLPA